MALGICVKHFGSFKKDVSAPWLLWKCCKTYILGYITNPLSFSVPQVHRLRPHRPPPGGSPPEVWGGISSVLQHALLKKHSIYLSPFGPCLKIRWNRATTFCTTTLQPAFSSSPPLPPKFKNCQIQPWRRAINRPLEEVPATLGSNFRIGKKSILADKLANQLLPAILFLMAQTFFSKKTFNFLKDDL